MPVMAHLPLPPARRPRPELRYVRAPEPVVFPESALMPENKSHLIVRTFLFQLLRYALGPSHSVGSEQFVYWNARDPKRSLAPDAFVKLDVPDTKFSSWKTWEQGGAPELAIEIASPSDADATPWREKLARYAELGTRELVRFDPEAAEGARIRVWDRIRDDLVERIVADARTPCVTLGVDWCAVAIEPEIVGLRLVDSEGHLIADREERAEARALVAEARANDEARERAAAEARVRSLEEELAKRV
jgi:Putative restriction endonuclease